MSRIHVNRFSGIGAYAPGIALSIVIALAASYLSEHYDGPAMLFALLLGMAFNALADNPTTKAGVEASSKSVLRIGVGLLGIRITFDSIISLGIVTVVTVIVGVFLTISSGYAIARTLKLGVGFSVISASAVAICGASAALAIASVLPQSDQLDRSTTLTVVAVTTLSTIAMLAYPIVAKSAGMSDHIAGIFLGATIHDVAQVVGAGYTISNDAGDTAAIVKLLRVSCLFPAVVIVGLLFSVRGPTKSRRPGLVPWFLIVFVALVVLGSFGVIPSKAQVVLSDASRWCLLIAVSALGVRTSLPALATVGMLPMVAIVLQTLLLGGFIYVMLTVNWLL